MSSHFLPDWCFDLKKNFVVAYSGGLDSHVLLHALSQIPDLCLSAIHINHGLSENAQAWSVHCQAVALELGVPCQIIQLDLQIKKCDSVEAIARTARYQALHQRLGPEDILLTAHTQNDQAETLLLQLLRGAGIHGLASMGEVMGNHYRPLLHKSRAELSTYAQRHQLQWIEDESNAHLRFDRNFIRKEILPQLAQRFPGVYTTLARSARLCQDALHLASDLAQEDFEKIRIDREGIDSDRLLQLSVVRQANVLRYWIAQQGVRYPSKAKLTQILSQMRSKSDAHPCIAWDDIVLRRHKRVWYCLKDKPKLCSLDDFSFRWERGQGFKVKDVSKLRLSYRQGGERCRPVQSPCSRLLKKWFQILEIPVWLRATIPLVYYEEELIGLFGFFICEGWQVSADELGLCLDRNRLLF